MDEFRVPDLKSAFVIGQARSLAEAFESAGLDQALIRSLGDGIGSLLYRIPADPTRPEAFNEAIVRALADLDGLYSEADILGSSVEELFSRADAELASIEAFADQVARATSRLRSLAAQTRADLVPIFSEDFGVAPAVDTSPQHYTDIPPLEVDAETGELRLPLQSEVSYLGRCSCRVANFLGKDLTLLQPASGTVLSDPGSLWYECLESKAPLRADVNEVSWLRGTGIGAGYNGGAAARLEIDFGDVVPVSEIRITPLSKHPVRVLGMEFDIGEYQSTRTNLLTGGDFSSPEDVAHWGPNAGWSPLYDGSLRLGGDGTMGMFASQTCAIPGGWVDKTFRFRLRYVKDSDYALRISLVFLSAVSPEVIIGTRDFFSIDPASTEPKVIDEEITLPAGTQYVRVHIMYLDTYFDKPLYISEVSLSAGIETLPLSIDLDAPRVVSVGRKLCRRMWLTVSQPHYEVKTVTRRKAYTTRYLPQFLGRYFGAVSEYTRAVLSRLFALAAPEDVETDLVYQYQIGLISIEPRFRTYYPAGRYVSLPITPPGDLRQLEVALDTGQWNPGLISGYLVLKGGDEITPEFLADSRSCAPITIAGERSSVSVVITPHEEIASALKAQQFSASPQKIATETHSASDVDRYMRLKLDYVPYVDYERVKSIQDKLRAECQVPGLPPLNYDPNQETISYAVPTDTGYTKAQTAGYRPIAVWITLPDGTRFVPDTLGASQPGLVGFVESEKLRMITQEEKTQYIQARASAVSMSEAYKTTIRTSTLYVPSNPDLTRSTDNPSKAAAELWWGTSVDDSLTQPVKNYEYDWSLGAFVIKESPPVKYKNNVRVTLNEVYARYSYIEKRPLSQIVAPASTPVNTKVTRNRTDYVTGRVPELKPYIDGVYEVYEYYVDPSGRLVFHESAMLFRERDVTITVAYESFKLSPRVVLEMRALGSDVSCVETPRIRGFTLFANNGVLGRW